MQLWKQVIDLIVWGGISLIYYFSAYLMKQFFSVTGKTTHSPHLPTSTLSTKFLSSGFFITQLYKSLEPTKSGRGGGGVGGAGGDSGGERVEGGERIGDRGGERERGGFPARIFQQNQAFNIRSGYSDNAVDMKGPFRNFLSDVASEWWGTTTRDSDTKGLR